MHSVDSMDPEGPVALQRANAWLDRVIRGIYGCESNELVTVAPDCRGNFDYNRRSTLAGD